MPCPHSKPVEGFSTIRYCEQRKWYTSAKKKKHDEAPCSKSAWDGPYEKCPWYEEES